MSDCVNDISDHVISSLLPRIRIRRIIGSDTVVLPPFTDSDAPMSCTAISCLIPHRRIPFSGLDVLIDSSKCFAAPGDCILFPEGCRRRFFHHDEGHRSVWGHFHFHLEPGLSLMQFFHIPRIIRGTAARRCRTLISRLNRGSRSILSGSELRTVAERRTGGLAEQLEDQALMLLLLKEILALSTPCDNFELITSGFHEFEGAMMRIRKHKFEKLTLDQLAEDCRMSRSSFEKKFRQAFGVSPGRYLLDLKLAAAETMLRESRDSCAQIAEKCGFSNPFLFSRLFSKRYGIPPRDYRAGRIFC